MIPSEYVLRLGEEYSKVQTDWLQTSKVQTGGYPAGFKMGSNKTKEYRLFKRDVVLRMAIITWLSWNFLHLSGLLRMGFALPPLIRRYFELCLGMFP